MPRLSRRRSQQAFEGIDCFLSFRKLGPGLIQRRFWQESLRATDLSRFRRLSGGGSKQGTQRLVECGFHHDFISCRHDHAFQLWEICAFRLEI